MTDTSRPLPTDTSGYTAGAPADDLASVDLDSLQPIAPADLAALAAAGRPESLDQLADDLDTNTLALMGHVARLQARIDAQDDRINGLASALRSLLLALSETDKS